jgi:hypothetical protein
LHRHAHVKHNRTVPRAQPVTQVSSTICSGTTRFGSRFTYCPVTCWPAQAASSLAHLPTQKANGCKCNTAQPTKHCLSSQQPAPTSSQLAARHPLLLHTILYTCCQHQLLLMLLLLSPSLTVLSQQSYKLPCISCQTEQLLARLLLPQCQAQQAAAICYSCFAPNSCIVLQVSGTAAAAAAADRQWVVSPSAQASSCSLSQVYCPRSTLQHSDTTAALAVAYKIEAANTGGNHTSSTSNRLLQ